MRLLNWFKRLSRTKKTLIILGIILLLYILYSLFKPKKPQAFPMDKIRRDTVTEVVTENGNVATTGDISVSAPINGIVTNITVKNGDTVVKDQKLMTIRSLSSDTEKVQAYAAYLNAVAQTQAQQQNKMALQTQLEQARTQILSAANNQNLLNSALGGSVPNPQTRQQYNQNEIDIVGSNLTSARWNFNSVEKKYKEADTAIGAAWQAQQAAWMAYQNTQDAEIKAPAAGVVNNFITFTGDNVRPSSASQTNAVMIISTNPTKYVKATVNEADVNKLKVGQEVQLLFNAIRDKTYKGHIAYIDTFGTNNQGVVTYNLVIVVDYADALVKPAMSSNISIVTARRENVLSVANAAVRPYKGGKAVQVKDKYTGKIHFVPVLTGLRGLSRTEIIAGVGEGTEVIVGPTQQTQNNAPAIGD